MVKTRDGAEVKLTVTDNPLLVAIVKSTMADIKPGMFVGSTGMTQPDGSQKAIEVHIFRNRYGEQAKVTMTGTSSRRAK